MAKRTIITILMALTSFGWAAAENILCFTAKKDESTIEIANKEGNNPNLEYALNDTKKWKPLVAGKPILLNAGGKIFFRGNNPQGFSQEGGRARSSFIMTGVFSAKGSVMSLIDGKGESKEIPNSECFYQLFVNCSSLTQAPELPATTLKPGCYQEMFKGCDKLTQAPILPATALEERCYAGMFHGCVSLPAAPELPGKFMEKSCYEGMFYGCSRIVKAPALPAKRMDESCYAYMFRNCSNLREIPFLPAEELAPMCYSRMFEQCPKINKVKVAFSDWGDGSIEERYTTVWLGDVAKEGTFISPGKLPAQYGSSNIPEGWEVIHEDQAGKGEKFLCFTALKPGGYIGMELIGENEPEVLYSKDGEKWDTLSFSDTFL